MSLPSGLMPPEVQAFVDELERRGFSIADERYEAERHFGNAFVDYAHDGLVIRVVRERGDWYGVIGGPELTDWFSPEAWWAILDGSPAPAQPMTLADQLDAVLQRLPRLQEVIQDAEPDILERLRTWQQQLSREWIQEGIPPSE
jgi:hypothetical protein